MRDADGCRAHIEVAMLMVLAVSVVGVEVQFEVH